MGEWQMGYKEDFKGCIMECFDVKLIVALFATLFIWIFIHGFSKNSYGIMQLIAVVPIIIYIAYIAKVVYEANNVEFIVKDGVITKHDIKKDKILNKYVANRDFNFIEIVKKRGISRFNIKHLQDTSSPELVDRITVTYGTDDELYNDIKKMLGYKEDKYSVSIERSKSNRKDNVSKIIFTVIALGFVYFILSNSRNLIFCIPMLLVFILVLISYIIGVKKMGKTVTSTITNIGVLIEFGNFSELLLKDGINMMEIKSGKETDDIEIHKSVWHSTDSDGNDCTDHFNLFIEGVEKYDTDRVADMISELKR